MTHLAATFERNSLLVGLAGLAFAAVDDLAW